MACEKKRISEKGEKDMERTKLCAEERETVITFDDTSDFATVYTCNKTMKTKLRKLQTEHSDEMTVTDDDKSWGSYSVIVPKKWVVVRPPRKSSRVYTEEQKKAMAERMRNAKEKK